MAKGGRQPGAGRPKGSVNKITADVKECILAAFDKSGGVDYLVEQAEKNPTAFMTLLGKILPKEMNIGGQTDNPLKTRMEIVIVEPDGSRTSV